MEFDIVSVPFNSTGVAGGTAAAPAALHAQGLAGRIRSALPTGWTPSEPPPVRAADRSLTRNPDSGLLNEQALVATIDGVADVVSAAFAAKRFPLLLGGDGSILLGALVAAGHRTDGPTGLLGFCGRECATPPDASPTGEAADSTLGLALVAHTNAVLSGGLSRRLPLLSPQAVALLGPRDAATLASAGVPSLAGSIMIRTEEELCSDRTPNAPAIGRHASEAGEHIRRTAGAWWLHVDLDVLSNDVMPHVDHRQPGGLTWEQLTALTRNALAQPGLVGWSLTSYNPDLDLNRKSAANIVDYIATCVSALPKSPVPPAPNPLTAPIPPESAGRAEPEAAQQQACQQQAHEAVHEAQLKARPDGQHTPVPSS